MPAKYPLFFQDNETLTAVVSPVSAYQYRDTNSHTGKANGFELYNFTSRKAIRKLVKASGEITAREFQTHLINRVNGKVMHCLNELKITSP